MTTPEGGEPGVTGPEGSWTHSFEEDADGLEVYRPTLGYPFPPSRQGRQRLLFEDRQVVEAAPGPDDRPRATGTLHATEPGLFREPGSGPGDAPGLEVVEARPDLLKIRRL